MDLFERIFQHENTERRDKSIWGVLTAKVTGRMGSSFELQYTGMGGNAPSAPARAMMTGAGDKRGVYFMPEVGDEVVVAFDSGDPNMPIILGGVWNGTSAPPEQAKSSDTENNIRTIVSRSGHEVTFDDTKAKEKIRIKTKLGHELVLDDTPPGKVTLTTKLGSKLEMDETLQAITVKAPLMVTIESPKITLAGSISMLPPVPPVPTVPPTPPSPPAPTVINAPLMLDVQSPLIKLKAAAIVIETTGNQLTSTVVIDGRPWASVL